MARKRKPKPKIKPKSIRIREDKLRPMLREAARTGLVEAIEHCHNFWSISDGFKKYIDDKVKLQADALMVAVRAALREERQDFARAVMQRTRQQQQRRRKR